MAQEKREYQVLQVVQQGRVHQQVRVVHVVQGLQEQHHVQVCQEYQPKNAQFPYSFIIFLPLLGLREIRVDLVGREVLVGKVCMVVELLVRMEQLVACQGFQVGQEHRVYRVCRACREHLEVRVDRVDNSLRSWVQH